MKYTLYGNKQSDTTIIAIPALGERAEFYYPLANGLNHVRWIVCDLPGHNGYDTKDIFIDSYIKNVKHVVDSLEITKVHLVGASIGATIIQAFYQKYPQAVQSLFLLDGGYYFLGELQQDSETMSSQKIENFEELKAAVHEFTYSIQGLQPQNYEQFEQYFLGNYIRENNYYRHHCDVDAFNHLSKEVDTVNYCLTQQVNIPIHLLLAETNLNEFTKQKAQQFQNSQPLANVVTIPNGHHYLPLTHTEEILGYFRKNFDL